MKTRRAPGTGTIDPEAHRVPGGVSRAAVPETVRRAERPLAVSEIADAVGLRLTPFVRPDLCLVTLADHHGPGRDAPGGREGPG